MQPPQATTEPLRLITLLAPLSLVTDMGMGSPDEQSMRACLLATGLARRMGLAEAEVRDVYYATLLKHLGCTATAEDEVSQLGVEEFGMRRIVSRTDFTRSAEVLSTVSRLGRGSGPLRRVRAISGLVTGAKWGARVEAGVCEVGAALARRIAISPLVEASLGQVFERWDGKGSPRKLVGEAIARPARFSSVASQVVAFAATDVPDAAIEMAKRRSGGWFDPSVVDALAAAGAPLIEEIMGADAFPAVTGAEPRPWLTIEGRRLHDVASAFGDMVDLKSSHFLGHSSGVAALAETAGRASGLPDPEVLELRLAGQLHDLGRVGVSALIWQKPGALSEAERERVHLHAYHTERILARCPRLAGLAQLAGTHHERADGSGYHRQLRGAMMSPSSRILAAADAFKAMTEPRPHRPAMTVEQAARTLNEEAKAGRFDGRAVDAVLASTEGGSARLRSQPRTWPAGLSDREVEVLRLVARGESNPGIAAALGISRRTAEHHVQHVYDKIGMSTRAGAALFALENGLLSRDT